MNKIRRLLLFILSFCFIQAANAQAYVDAGVVRLDSLKKVLAQITKDTAKLNTLNQLAQQYINLNYLPSADSTARQAIKLADQLNYKKYKGESYNKIGTIHLMKNEADSARFYYTKAVEEDKRTRNKNSYIIHLGNIGISYVLEQRYDQALSCHQTTLHIAELFKEKSTLAFCYNNIGMVYSILLKPRQAMVYFMKSLACNTDNHDKNSKYISLKFISGIYQSEGNYSEALKYLNQALDVAKIIGNKYKVQVCLSSLGNIYANLGDRASSLEYDYQALKIAEEVGNKKDIANLLSDIGGRYYEMGDKKKGVELLKKGYDKMVESGDKLGIAQTTGNIGLVYYEEGDLDKSINYYKQSITLMDEVGISDISMSWLNNVAIINGIKADRTKNKDSIDYFYKESMFYFNKAMRIADSLGRRNELVHSYQLIGGYYEHQNKLKEAEVYYKKCIQLSVLTGEISYRQEAHNKLSEIYGKQGKYEQQVEQYKLYIVLKDSSTNIAGAEKKVRSEMNFEYEQKQTIEKEKQKQRNQLLAAEKKRQKTILWSMISCMLLIMVAAAFMYRSYLNEVV
jgi:tetratricopeptide (TPR) repeat protein